MQRRKLPGRAALGPKALTVAGRHRWRLPRPSLHHLQKLKPGREHVLRRPDPGGVPGGKTRELQPGRCCEIAEYPGHVLVTERARANLAALGQRPEQRPALQACRSEPCLDMRHGVGRQVLDCAFAFLVGFRASHQDGAGAVGAALQISDLQGHELGAAQQSVVGDGHEGGVAERDQRRLGLALRHAPMQALGRLRGDHAIDAGTVEGLGLLLAPALGPVHPLDREPHDLVGTRVRQAGGPVQRGDRGAVAFDRGARLHLGLGIDESGDRLGRRRQHRPAGLPAPGGEDAAVGGEGPDGVGGEGTVGGAGVALEPLDQDLVGRRQGRGERDRQRRRLEGGFRGRVGAVEVHVPSLPGRALTIH